MGTIVYNPDNGVRFKQNAGTIDQISVASTGGSSLIQLWEGCGCVVGRAEAFLIVRFHFPAPVVVPLNAPLPPLRRFTINSQQDAV